MAIDGIEAPSPPSQPQSISHFRLQFKMETLVDLLGVAGRHTCLPMVVCCRSRDELDAVCSVASILPYISFSSLYSDLVEAERTQILETFWQATVSWNQNVSAQSGDDSETGKDSRRLETYMRRIATCLAADGVVINMVVGGEVVTLKSIEESSNLVIAEMPINVSFVCFVFLLSLNWKTVGGLSI
ncbi:hypothetical protein QYF36_022430 [Acer negundo]|nr:hypothetical protein QYF36_008518 [Acer negundo]KAK4858809.1 hypothetical protein QYF36_022430 [Acer negundo]